MRRAKIVADREVFRSRSQRPPVVRHRLGGTADVLQCVCEIEQRIGVVRLEPHRLLQLHEGLVKQPLSPQQDGEIIAGRREVRAESHALPQVRDRLVNVPLADPRDGDGVV